MNKPTLIETEADDAPAQRGRATRLILECKRVLVLGFVLTGLVEVLALAPIIYMMNLFDRVMTSRSVVTLVSLTVLFVVSLIFDASVKWLRRRLLLKLALRLDWDLSSDIFDASFRRFAGHKRVNVQQVMSDLAQVRKFFQGSGYVTLVEVPFTFLFTAVLATISTTLALFAVGTAVVMILLSAYKARTSSGAILEAQQARAETSRSVAESLRHAETALALGMQANIRRRWYAQHQRDLVLESNSHESSGVVGGLINLLGHGMPMLTKGFAVFLAITGEMSSGKVIATMFLVRHTTGPIQKFFNQWPGMTRARASLERLDKLLGDDDLWADKVSLPEAAGHLQVEHLTATAGKGRRVLLHDIQFDLHPGQVLAVVGASAAGKTTLVRHLVGISRAQEGRVRLDGADIYDWVRSGSVPHIGYVPQDVLVLEGTVAENIARMGQVDDHAVVRAAELIDLHRAILSFPEGYETQLGEDGFRLTGGQKQKLIIARALYGDPKLVVLDEPSSSLDADSEAALLRLMRILRNRGTTVVVTTHRQNLVDASDLVLKLDQGRIVAFGPAQELAAHAFTTQVDPEPTPAAPARRRSAKT